MTCKRLHWCPECIVTVYTELNSSSINKDMTECVRQILLIYQIDERFLQSTMI